MVALALVLSISTDGDLLGLDADSPDGELLMSLLLNEAAGGVVPSALLYPATGATEDPGCDLLHQVMLRPAQSTLSPAWLLPGLIFCTSWLSPMASWKKFSNLQSPCSTSFRVSLFPRNCRAVKQ